MDKHVEGPLEIEITQPVVIKAYIFAIRFLCYLCSDNFTWKIIYSKLFVVHLAYNKCLVGIQHVRPTNRYQATDD